MKRIDSTLAKFKEEIYVVQQDINQAYYERAINKIYELMILHPDRAEPHYEMGRIAYNFWNNDEAESHYQKAIEIDPHYFPAYTQYCLILIKQARFDEAAHILQKAQLLSSREDADIYFYMGMVYQHKGELDSAIENFTKAINFSISEGQIDLNLKFIRACKELRGWE